MRNNFTYVCVVLLLAASCSAIYGQAKPNSPATAAVAPTADYSKEPYVIELLEDKARFEADGKGQRDLTIKLRVQSESAVRDFGVLTYPFASSFESLDVVYVRVRKPDGTVLETPATDIQELDSAVSREAPMYTDGREKHIAVKSLTVGDTLEAHLKWTVHDPLAPGHFWFSDSYYKAGICLAETLDFDVPTNVPVKIHNTGQPPSIREEGGRRIYTFRSANLQHAEESKIPDWEKNSHGAPLPDIEISSFTSWAEVGAWYGGLQQSKVAVTPEIKAKAEELTKGVSTEEGKIRAIYDFVSTRFRYIGIDLGIGRYTPHAATDVLVNRYGDCKDKHTLFAALLQAVGVQANPALVSSKFKIDADFPSASVFDHVITAIPRGASFLFLDTTSELAPFGLLMPAYRDSPVLVIPSGSEARLVTTPVDSLIPNYEHVTADASIDAQGTLEAKMRFEIRGDGEIGMRLAYRNTPQNKWQELTQAILARLGFGGTASEVTAAPPENTSEPFWISLSYHRPEFPDWKEHRIVLLAPPMFLPDLNEEQKKSKEPLPLGALQDLTYDCTIKFPPGYVVFPPEKVERKTDFAEYSANYSTERAVLHGTLHLRILLHDVPGGERAKFVELTKTIDETSRRYIPVAGGDFLAQQAAAASVFAKAVGKPAEAIPILEQQVASHPELSLAILQLSRAYCKTGRAKDAVALLERSSEANPAERQRFQLELGHAYLAVSDNEKASKAFKDYLGEDPTSRELNEVATDLAEANVQMNEALDYSTRAVKSISEDTEDIQADPADHREFSLMSELAANWNTFGLIKLRMGDADLAEKFLEAAWELDQRPDIGEHLVEAYELHGKAGKAAVVGNMSMALVSTTIGDWEITKRKLEAEMTKLQPNLEAAIREGYFGVHSKQGQVGLVDMRSADLVLPFPLHSEVGNATFVILFTNGEKTRKAFFVSGTDELRKAESAVAAVKYFQTFPDETPSRILRRASLNCSKYASRCTLMISTVEDTIAPNFGVQVPVKVVPTAKPN